MLRLAIGSLLGAIACAYAQNLPPRLFFSDLESGPNTGGEGDRGVFVTVWGRNFGASQGSSRVTIGGGPAALYPVWTDTKVTFQLGPDARTGPIVLITASGGSNCLPFEVRPGNIFFVSRSGDDSADGSFAKPWRTLVKAKNSMAAGDTTYALDGVSAATVDESSAALSVTRGGSPGRPVALVAYPGATVTIGGPNDPRFGMRVPNLDEAADADYWVVSQLVLRGRTAALALGGPSPSNWRVVGNDLSCPVGEAGEACFVASLGSHIQFFGNEVHDTGDAEGSKLYAAVYFTTDTNNVEAAWNHLHDNRSCRGIQIHSSPLCIPDCTVDRTGLNQYNISVHDNLIRDTHCDAINFATVNPSKGKVEAYNNVVIRSGTGPHPKDKTSNYACIYVAGITNTGPDGFGSVEIYNNTCYDFGSVDPASPDAGGFLRGPGSPRLMMNLRNNIVYARTGQRYIGGLETAISGWNNLFFGNGAGPAFLQGNINADPAFVSIANGNLRLQADAPAINAGLDTGLRTDFDGNPRPQGRATDIGAFEWTPQQATTPGGQP